MSKVVTKIITEEDKDQRLHDIIGDFSGGEVIYIEKEIGDLRSSEENPITFAGTIETSLQHLHSLEDNDDETSV